MKKPKSLPLPSLLVSWIGQTDLNAAMGNPEAGIGPIAQAVAFKPFSRLALLSDYPADQTRIYLDWLRQRTTAPLDLHPCQLSSPMHFGEIYQAARQVLSDVTAGTSQSRHPGDGGGLDHPGENPLSRRIAPVLESQRR